MNLLYLIFGFIMFLGLGWHIIVGYELIRKLCKKSQNNESLSELENKIIYKSYLAKSLDKITTLAISSMFMFELEKYRYSLDVGYMILLLITIATYNISPYISNIFIGATIFEVILWIYKIITIIQFKKVFSQNIIK